MTPEQAIGILHFIHPQLEHEYETTRRVLAAVPDEQAEYRPHSTNMSAQQLAAHIAFTDIWFLESIIKGAFENPGDSGAASLKPSEVLAAYDAKMPRLLEEVKNVGAEQLATKTSFFMFNLPLVAYLQFAQKHTIHHRGQMSVYLRPMGAKVPSIYGGSADEPMTARTGA
jgi:uncharacterized damage-inducible protein DinB